jgi:hypothetical protein
MRTWALVAVTTGFLAVATYFCSIVFKPFPWSVGRILFFAFGPLSVASVVAFYRATEWEAGGILHTLGSLFLVVAGVIVNLMAVIQDVQFTVLGRQIREAGDPAIADVLERVLWGVNVVQSGLDVSWDIFASVGTVMLALSLTRHPAFGRIWSALGASVAAAALVLNLATFPTSPADAGLVDLGPGVGAWYGVTLVLFLRFLPRLEEDSLRGGPPVGNTFEASPEG